MKVYKLFRVRNGKLYPLYVNANKELEVGKWLRSESGEKADETHVKSKLGKLSLRSGYHSTKVPFTDWIGKRMDDGTLAQKPDTVWCECEVKGTEVQSPGRYGYREVPKDSWYYFKTNAKQRDPWIISDLIKIKRVLKHDEVEKICAANGLVAQAVA